MIITHKVNMDLVRPWILQALDVMQDDKYSRNIEFTITQDGAALSIPEETTALVRFCKPDGTGGNYDELPDGTAAYTISGNVVTIALAPQVCTATGKVLLAVCLINNITELHTFSVNINVHRNPGLVAHSENYFKIAGSVADSGWKPNMYLGTDKNGNVVEKQPSMEITGEVTAEVDEYTSTGTHTTDFADIEEYVLNGGIPRFVIGNDPYEYRGYYGAKFWFERLEIGGAEAVSKLVYIGASGEFVLNISKHELGGSGVGLADTEKTLILSLFRNAAYTADMSATFAQLEALWSGSGGGEEEPDEPTVPDESEVTLTSISATYSGGSVTAGTAVTALTGIVVVASYSDGTSKAVTDYTLSGTIAEGSNTITVSYGCMTTTFTVTGVAETVTYTITNDLTNVTNSNSATAVESGSGYSAILSVEDGYSITSLVVTMGGVDVTETAFQDGTLYIAPVTGDIVITAVAAEIAYVDAIANTASSSYDNLTIYSDDGATTIYNAAIYNISTAYSKQRTETDVSVVAEFTNTTDADITVTVYAGSAGAALVLNANRATAYYGISASRTIRAGETVTLPFTVKAGYYAFAFAPNGSISVAIQGVLDVYTPTAEYALATRKPDVTTFYSDAGETSVLTKYYNQHHYTTEQFTEDTEVRVTVVSTDTTLTMLACGCVSAITGNPAVHYYTYGVSATKQEATPGNGVVLTMNYTVKAGYYLFINEDSNEIYVEKV